ncbi:MAG: DUF1592 domain-containing protein [Myxococcaceae bacterium]|nr:DUF1592 domain-containing protein [Myxococcaceae bacterium]
MCVALLACEGRIATPPAKVIDNEEVVRGGGGDKACKPEVEAAPPRRIWLLSNTQYRATISALFPSPATSGLELVPEAEQTYQGTQAELMRLGRSAVPRVMANADTIAAHVRANLASYVTCNVEQEACLTTFLETFGTRVFRRPLDVDQKAGLTEVYRAGRETSGARGFELVVSAMLQSAAFLYRSEVGTTDNAPAGEAQLSAYELAELLSYSLTEAPPDADLLALAANETLFDPVVYGAQLERLAATPAGRRVHARFAEVLLSGSSVARISKDVRQFPQFGPELAADMREEVRLFVEDVAASSEPSVARLLTSKTGFVNERTAPLYGRTVTGGGFQRVTHDSPHRIGMLTTPLFAAVYSQPDHVVPTARGRFVYNQVLCRTMATPPTIDPALPAANPSLSPRERLAVIEQNASCASCHRIADPIGFAFERLDPIGAERDLVKGKPIDTSGEIRSSLETDGAFDDVTGLAERLAQSNEVRDCFATQFFRFAQGRATGETDGCRLTAVREQVAAEGGTLPSLVQASLGLEASGRTRRVVE